MIQVNKRITMVTTVWIWCIGIMLCFMAIPNTDSYGQRKEYPQKTIKIKVGTTPGGVADLWVRAWADEFSKILKVPVVVENIAGASGIAAETEAAVAKPDGYTLVECTLSSVLGNAISPKPPYDILRDFSPIGALGSFPTLVVVENSSPFKTYEDLIDYAKNNPKKLNCGTAGSTIVSHLTFELLKQQAKVDIVMVPFNGSPPAITALLGKHVDLLSISPSSLIGLLKEGRVRALLTTERTKDFPDVPIFSEKGLVEAQINTWLAILAQSGVSNEIKSKLTDAFEKVAKDPKVIDRIEKLGFSSKYQNATELAATMKRDFEKLKSAAKQFGIIK